MSLTPRRPRARPRPKQYRHALRSALAPLLALAVSHPTHAQGAERLAWTALDTGRPTECAQAFARFAIDTHIDRGPSEDIARTAFWTAQCAARARARGRARQWLAWLRRHHPESFHARVASRPGADIGAPPDWSTLIEAIITVESSGHHDARSPTGALGLMQLMPATAKKLLRPSHTAPDTVKRCLLDPRCNRRLGEHHLLDLARRLDRDLIAVLAAYAAWHRRHRDTHPLEAIDRLPILETRRYVARVIAETCRRTERVSHTACRTYHDLRAGRRPRAPLPIVVSHVVS